MAAFCREKYRVRTVKIREFTDFSFFLIEKFVRLLYTCPVMMKVWIRFFEPFP